jgi:hypothetical protein
MEQTFQKRETGAAGEWETDKPAELQPRAQRNACGQKSRAGCTSSGVTEEAAIYTRAKGCWGKQIQADSTRSRGGGWLVFTGSYLCNRKTGLQSDKDSWNFQNIFWITTVSPSGARDFRGPKETA